MTLLATLFLSALAFANPKDAAKPADATKRAPASQSVVVRACDDRTPTNLEYFVDKRSYSNENVRVFNVDTMGEPACCSTHVVIYFPDKSEPMGTKCFHVASTADGLGFSGVNLSRAKSAYNSKTGLSLTIPFFFYSDTGNSTQKNFQLVINQDTQTVQVK